MRILEQVKKGFEEKGDITISWLGEYRRRLKFNKKCKKKRITLYFMKYFVISKENKE